MVARDHGRLRDFLKSFDGDRMDPNFAPWAVRDALQRSTQDEYLVKPCRLQPIDLGTDGAKPRAQVLHFSEELARRHHVKIRIERIQTIVALVLQRDGAPLVAWIVGRKQPEKFELAFAVALRALDPSHILKLHRVEPTRFELASITQSLD